MLSSKLMEGGKEGAERREAGRGKKGGGGEERKGNERGNTTLHFHSAVRFTKPLF